MKRTLVVDDIRTSDHVPEFAKRDFVYATTSREAIAQLEREPFDAVWLDYDLAWNNPDREDNGLRVARWLAANGSRFAAREVWIITDLDRFGEEMAACLRSAAGADFEVRVTDLGHRWNELWHGAAERAPEREH